MIRFRNSFAAMLFVCVLLGLPLRLRAQAPDIAKSSANAAGVHAESRQVELLKAVLQTRDEVRALRQDVDGLRQLLESTRAKSESDRLLQRLRKVARDFNPPPIDGVYFFNASWCGPGQQMQPVVQRFKREGLPIVKIDVDEHPDLIRFFRVEKLPTVVLWIGGQEKDRHAGVMAEEALRRLLDKLPNDKGTAKPAKTPPPAVSNVKTELRPPMTNEASAHKAGKAKGIPEKHLYQGFIGNASVPSQRLAMELTTGADFVNGEYNPASLAKDVTNVRKYYENLGYFNVKVIPRVEYSKDRSQIWVRYTVQEGQRYRIHKLSLLGNTRFNKDELRKAIQTREGQFYDFLAAQKDAETIKQKYVQMGYTATTQVHYSRHLDQPGMIDLDLVTYEDKPYEPRAYPVADLVVPLRGRPKTNVHDNLDKLVGLVTDTVEPKTWDKAGGAGSIAQYEPSLSLVIRQTAAGHRHVAAFLRGLRSLHDWQVCLELTLVENPASDLMRSIGVSSPSEGDKRVLPLTDEQRAELLAALDRNRPARRSSVWATLFYGQRWPIHFDATENRTIDAEIADSTDRYSVNLKFDLHDVKIGQAKADPVNVNIPNLKTVVLEFTRSNSGATARPSLLIVRPRLLFPIEEEETKD
jgi:thiol-disulfide isomerase/thioredoxin